MGALLQLPGAATAVERILSRFDRKQIEDFIEVAISLLDLASGDPDLEDDDPSGGAADDQGEPGEAFATRPVYEVDQSAGPINQDEAFREHQISMMRPEEQVRMRAQIERNGR